MEKEPLVVDVRGLACPKPFQRAQTEAMMLAPGETFTLQISIRPQPLLDYLEQHHFSYHIKSTAAGDFLIEISAKSDSIALDHTVVEPPAACTASTN